MGDRAYRLLLLTDLDAERLITSLRCSPLLFGHRGRPRADVAARVWGWVAFAAVDALQELVQVGAGEPPVEGFGDGVVAGFERGEAVADLAQVGEVVRADDLALDDGEVDLSLVRPGGVDGQVDQVGVRPGRLHPCNGAGAAVGGAVVR